MKMSVRKVVAHEMRLYQSRPDLWGLSKALELAPTYKSEIWSLLSDSDREALTDYVKALTPEQ